MKVNVSPAALFERIGRLEVEKAFLIAEVERLSAELARMKAPTNGVKPSEVAHD